MVALGLSLAAGCASSGVDANESSSGASASSDSSGDEAAAAEGAVFEETDALSAMKRCGRKQQSCPMCTIEPVGGCKHFSCYPKGRACPALQ
jgi:hypothetical protein